MCVKRGERKSFSVTTDSSSAGLAGKGKGVIRRRLESEARLGEAFFPQGMGRQSSTASREVSVSQKTLILSEWRKRRKDRSQKMKEG